VTVAVLAEAGGKPGVLPPELLEPELLLPESGILGRYSSPADAARADETSTRDAISVNATIEAVR
jgi:hypothetical protein